MLKDVVRKLLNCLIFWTLVLSTTLIPLSGIVFFCTEITSAELIEDDHIIGLWHFDDCSGQYTVDSSGLGNNGTLGTTSGIDSNDPSWVTGKYNNALEFDGNNDCVIIPDDSTLDITDQLTITAWIYDMGDITNIAKHIVHKTYCKNYELWLYNNGYLYFRVGDGSETKYSELSSAEKLNENTWYHVAATFNNSVMKLYINGNLSNSKSTTINKLGVTSDPVIIGNVGTDFPSFNYNRPFKGIIDEVCIWNRTLTATEIMNCYNTVVKKYIDLSIIHDDISFSDSNPNPEEIISINAIIKNMDYNGLIFQDSFEHDLSNWTKIYGNPKTSTNESRSGSYSAEISSDLEAIKHEFPSQIKGRAEFWFYDMLSSKAQTIVSIDDDDIPGKGAFSLGVITAKSQDYYIYQIGSWYDTTITSIPRSAGWHKFEFISDGIKSTAYIDDNLVATTTRFKTFFRIDLGDWWSDGYYMTTYIDDVKVFDHSLMNEITAKVAFYDGDLDDSGILIGSKDIEFWENTMVETSIDWVAMPGIHDIYVRIENIDPSDSVESNNIAFKSITVPIPAIINIAPDELNLKSKGKWVTGYIKLQEGFDFEDIDETTVSMKCEGFELDGENGVFQEDCLMMKFDRQELIAELSAGIVELSITGKLDEGSVFKGSDEITVIDESV